MSKKKNSANLPENCVVDEDPENPMPSEEICFISLDVVMSRLPKGERLILPFYDRASEASHNDNPEDRWPIIKAELAEKYRNRLQLPERLRFCETKKGRSTQLHNRPALSKAIEYCQKHQCVLVAPSVHRIIRIDCLGKKNRLAPLRERDFMRLARFAQGVVVATVIPPETPPKEVQKIFIKWGQKAKGKGGRPKKKPPGYLKERRKTYRPIARKLCRKGLSYPKIKDELLKIQEERLRKNEQILVFDFPETTIADWVRDVRAKRMAIDN